MRFSLVILRLRRRIFACTHHRRSTVGADRSADSARFSRDRSTASIMLMHFRTLSLTIVHGICVVPTIGRPPFRCRKNRAARQKIILSSLRTSAAALVWQSVSPITQSCYADLRQNCGFAGFFIVLRFRFRNSAFFACPKKAPKKDPKAGE